MAPIVSTAIGTNKYEWRIIIIIIIIIKIVHKLYCKKKEKET